MLTLSDSHIGQARLESKFTREQVSTCRKRISGDAKHNQTTRLVPRREKHWVQHTNTRRAEGGSETHIEQAEHSKPSRESQVDCELSSITSSMILPLCCSIPRWLKD